MRRPARTWAQSYRRGALALACTRHSLSARPRVEQLQHADSGLDGNPALADLALLASHSLPFMKAFHEGLQPDPKDPTKLSPEL